MKKIFLFIAFLWISLVSFAQDGVNFEHLSFREALTDFCRLLYFLVWAL